MSNCISLGVVVYVCGGGGVVISVYLRMEHNPYVWGMYTEQHPLRVLEISNSFCACSTAIYGVCAGAYFSRVNLNARSLK